MSVQEIEAVKSAIIEILSWIFFAGFSVFMFLACSGAFDSDRK